MPKAKARRQLCRKERKTTKINYKVTGIIAGILAVIVVIIIIVAIPAFAAYKSGLKTFREAKLIASAAKEQNIDLASSEIAQTQSDLAQTEKNFHYLVPLKFIPIVNWYYDDADHMMNAATDGLQGAQLIATSLKPYADVLGLKGTSSGGSVQQQHPAGLKQ